MKITFTFFIALVFQLTGFSQNLAPVGAKWFGGYGITYEYRLLECTNDTLINGKQCVEIKHFQPLKNGDRVYLKSEFFTDSLGFVSFIYNNEFYPYFNFNSQKGDTIVSTKYGINSGAPSGDSIVVDSIYMKEGLKHFVTRNLYEGMKGLVIQRVLSKGFVVNMAEPVTYLLAGALVGTDLQCYTDNQIQYRVKENSSCGFDHQYYSVAALNADYFFSKYRSATDNTAPYFRLKYKNGRLQYFTENNMLDDDGEVHLKTENYKTYVNNNGEWILLYDFGAKTGDTITTKAVIRPLLITNNASGYEDITTYRYIIDSVYEQADMLYQRTRSIPGERWEMPGILREDMGSEIALLGQPINTNQTGKQGYVRCFSSSSYPMGYTNFKDVKKCDALYLSVKENELLNQVFVYPNPATKNLTISINQQLQNTRLTLTDVVGKTQLLQIIKGGETAIQTDYLKSGLYFVILENNDERTIIKLIIQ